jgi:hypothetical protein
VLHSECGSILLCSFHCFFQKTSWVLQLQLWDARQGVVVCEVRLLRVLISVVVHYFSVDASLGLVFDPFADKKFVLFVIKVGALALTLIFNPMAFKMITISLCQNSIAVTLAFMPLTLVNVFVCIDHSAFALRQSVNPITIVPVSIFVEESSSAMHLVLEPVTCVLSTQLATFIAPKGSLTVTLVNSPHALVFVSLLIVLDSEALFAVVFPVTNIP